MNSMCFAWTLNSRELIIELSRLKIFGCAIQNKGPRIQNVEWTFQLIDRDRGMVMLEER